MPTAVAIGVAAVVGVGGYYGVPLIMGSDIERKKSGLKTNIGTQQTFRSEWLHKYFQI